MASSSTSDQGEPSDRVITPSSTNHSAQGGAPAFTPKRSTIVCSTSTGTMLGPSAKEERCAMCNSPSTIKCDHCKNIWYCSPVCEQRDSAVHCLVCPWFRNIPDSLERICIYFPVNSRFPEFYWKSPVPRTTVPNHSVLYAGDPSHNVRRDGPDRHYPDDLHDFDYDYKLNRELRHRIVLLGNPITSAAPFNMCLSFLTGTNFYRGDIIACGFRTPRDPHTGEILQHVEAQEGVNLDAMDVRHIVNCVQEYFSRQFFEPVG